MGFKSHESSEREGQRYSLRGETEPTMSRERSESSASTNARARERERSGTASGEYEARGEAKDGERHGFS